MFCNVIVFTKLCCKNFCLTFVFNSVKDLINIFAKTDQGHKMFLISDQII